MEYSRRQYLEHICHNIADARVGSYCTYSRLVVEHDVMGAGLQYKLSSSGAVKMHTSVQHVVGYISCGC